MMNKIIASASSADLALIRSRIFWKATVGGTDPGNAYEFERGVSIWQYRDTQGIDEDRAFLTPDEWRRYADGNVEVPVSEIHADGSPPSDPAYHEVLKSWTTADGKLWVTYDAPPPPPPPVDPPPPPPPTGEPPVDITLAGDVWIGLLQYGTQDSDSVRRMQKVLNGISLPPPGNVTIDLKSGNYGPQTDDVVRTWQASIGDPVDPKGASSVGPKQAARLFAGTPVNLRIGSPGDATPPPPPPPPPASGVTTLFDGGRVTTPYGVPGSWAAGHHTGDDWACATGTHVRTTWSGPVVATNAWGAAYGNHVIQEITVNGETRRQAFCHLQSIEVRVGQMLHPGDWIGRADSTGNVTGPHVHLEQRTAPYGYANHDVKPVY
jgi:murein DD-endopeptidase MepM/ murein hydrolase activator NlpD